MRGSPELELLAHGDAAPPGADFASAMPDLAIAQPLENANLDETSGTKFLHAKCKLPLFWAGVNGVDGMLKAKQRAAIARAKPLHEAAIERLRDMIVEGDLAAGERLNDARLAALLSVSRTPIREAIKLLANEGLVELLPGRGARVATLPLESISEMFEVIAGLERHACELAAERMSEPTFEALQKKHERMLRYFEAGERRGYFKLNHEIHLALVAASGNAALQALHATLIARARRARYAALESADRWREAMGEHEALMKALRRRDARKAGEIMREHDRRTAEAILARLGASSREAALVE